MTTLIQSILKKSDLDYVTFTDSVSKFRVSTPESLIDTDFEYGLQSIKWETAQFVNNIPTFFSRSGDTPIPLVSVTSTSGQSFIYVTTTVAHNLINGAPFSITGLKSVTAEGTFTITKVLSATSFVYEAKYVQTLTTNLFIKDCSMLFPGMVYQGTSFTAQQIESMETNSQPTSTITVKTIAPHGFSLNAFLSLTNTYGQRTITITLASSVAAGGNINVPNHGLYTGMSIIYTSPGSGMTLSAVTQTVGTEYQVSVVDKDNIRIANTSGVVLAMAFVAGTYIFTSRDSVSDGSDYSITSIPDPYTFQINSLSGGQINGRTLSFIPGCNLVMNNGNPGSNTITFPTVHNLITGAVVTYNDQGTNIGLTNNQDYFVIVRSPFTISLATTYNNAMNNIVLPITTTNSLSTSATNLLTSRSLLGEEYGPGTVTLTAGSTTITGTGTNFLSYFKPGMPFRAVLPSPTAITYTISSVSGTTINVTPSFPSAVTNLPMRYTGTGNANFLNGKIYYITASGGVISSAAASPGGAALSATGVPNGGTFITIVTSSIFESRVTQVLNSTSFTVATAPTATVTNTNYMIQSAVYPFCDSYVYHRAFDGGVELIPSNNADAQLTRQTRKYFRYQPGKGIQCSLSVNFSAPIEIDYLQRSGLTATARTRRPHRLKTGLSITVMGSSPLSTQWTGTYTITSVPTINTFTYTLTSAPTETIANGFPKFKVNSWTGSRLRAGLFDDHNGMFFEFDGTSMHAVRRDSVSQISGTVDLVFNSNRVTANSLNPTRFATQLTLKQNVVIRGQTYRVVYIQDDSTFFIQPAYRGVSEENCIVSLVTDTRAPSSAWSIDKCDGTGPTGYILDVNKIQMIYMDYSWYGAGKIRFGFKDKAGVVRYVHEFSHNNIQDTAYFRSGNLPGRYEVYNVGDPTWVPPLLHWGTAVIMDGRYDDDKSYLFTANGNILSYTNSDRIQVSATYNSVNNVSTQQYDYNYRGLVPAFSITSVGGADTSSNSWTKLQNIKSGTILSGPQVRPNTFTLSTPQKDDTDATKAIIFINQSLSSFVLTPSTFTFGQANDPIPSIIPLVSIRVAPSVDSSLTGALGVRELVNHMQLRLKSVDILTTNDTELRIYLNAFINNRNFVAASSPSLSQLVTHNKGDTLQDGTILFSYRVPGGIYDSSGKRTSTCTSYDISGLGFLGNSIQGGDGIYPDGPDVLTLAAVCMDTGGVAATTPYLVSARVTWAEAQA